MSLLHSDNVVHRAALLSAEQTRQANAGVTAASVRAADIAFYRAARASAIANNCSAAAFTVA
jgi:hypothetical protein